jgi:hypothetical protein
LRKPGQNVGPDAVTGCHVLDLQERHQAGPR